MLTNLLNFLANHNFFRKYTLIRKIQCYLFGHEWFTWVKAEGAKSGWCAWCATVTSPYPRMRERKHWDYAGGGTNPPYKDSYNED